MNEILQYVVFGDWFLSLSTMLSRFIHNVTERKTERLREGREVTWAMCPAGSRTGT